VKTGGRFLMTAYDAYDIGVCTFLYVRW
jgi:hypothetical protein